MCITWRVGVCCLTCGCVFQYYLTCGCVWFDMWVCIMTCGCVWFDKWVCIIRHTGVYSFTCACVCVFHMKTCVIKRECVLFEVWERIIWHVGAYYSTCECILFDIWVCIKRHVIVDMYQSTCGCVAFDMWVKHTRISRLRESRLERGVCDVSVSFARGKYVRAYIVWARMCVCESVVSVCGCASFDIRLVREPLTARYMWSVFCKRYVCVSMLFVCACVCEHVVCVWTCVWVCCLCVDVCVRECCISMWVCSIRHLLNARATYIEVYVSVSFVRGMCEYIVCVRMCASVLCRCAVCIIRRYIHTHTHTHTHLKTANVSSHDVRFVCGCVCASVLCSCAGVYLSTFALL